MSGSNAGRLFVGDIPEQHEDDEVAQDAVQLAMIATFNGLCRLIAALSHNGLLSPDQLANIEDAMTTPLDDPDWLDDPFIVATREAVEKVLARAVGDASVCWHD